VIEQKRDLRGLGQIAKTGSGGMFGRVGIVTSLLAAEVGKYIVGFRTGEYEKIEIFSGSSSLLMLGREAKSAHVVSLTMSFTSADSGGCERLFVFLRLAPGPNSKRAEYDWPKDY
jgi:hypothetical protein